jgi:hypothetical protein
MTLTPDPASARRRRDDVAGKALSLSIPDCQTLDDHSRLSLILGRLHSDPDQLAGDLLARFGSLAAAAADPSELTRRFLMGPAALSNVKILREMAVRLVRVEACRRPVITSWIALQAYVRAAMAHLPSEQFRVLGLDRRTFCSGMGGSPKGWVTARAPMSAAGALMPCQVTRGEKALRLSLNFVEDPFVSRKRTLTTWAPVPVSPRNPPPSLLPRAQNHLRRTLRGR